MIGLMENKIAVIPLYDADVSPGGIIIPEMAKERCDQGVVKYVGPDCQYLVPGDLVLFSGYTGQTVRIDNEVLIFMREDAVSAVLEGEDLDNTAVPGLYFKGKDGVYFEANVEFALDLVGRAVQDAPWRKSMKSQDMLRSRPTEVRRNG